MDIQITCTHCKTQTTLSGSYWGGSATAKPEKREIILPIGEWLPFGSDVNSNDFILCPDCAKEWAVKREAINEQFYDKLDALGAEYQQPIKKDKETNETQDR